MVNCERDRARIERGTMWNKLRFVLVLTASTALGAGTASAHHPGVGGIGGAGGIFTIGAGTLDQGQFAFSEFIEYIRLKQLSDATLLANIGKDVHGLQSIESKILAFSAGITNDLMVSVRVPWVRRTGILEGVQEDPADPPTVRDRGSTSGFGDVAVLGQYRFLNNVVTGAQAAMLFGFKEPTGRTGLVDPFGELFEAEFQPGSGSWDGLFGVAFSQQLAPAWSFHANVLGIVTGTGTQDTNLGNRFLYNTALAYRVFGETAGEPHSHDARTAYAHVGHSHEPMVTKAGPKEAPHAHIALDAFLELNGEWHDKQRTAGIADPNSGGSTIYLSPGLRLTVESWSSYVLVGVPVVNDLNGIQAAPSWRVIGGISVVLGP
jgi:outer membrane putative beta-barrel porin/alpha-amylase